MHSVVSAVYDVKPGEAWPRESLAALQQASAAHGLVFDVVESIPVHEDIKLGRGNVDTLLDINEESARTFAEEICAEGGIAKAYACNVLDKAACTAVAKAVESDLGKCDILINGADGTPTARTGKILAATPMGRFGETEELAGGLLFLLNEKAAGFITGVVLPIDGGFSAYSGV